MRHNLLTKILVLVLALLVLIPNMGLGVFAAEGDGTEGSTNTPPVSSFDVSGSKKAAPTDLNSNNRETTVTLSLPSGEYKNKIDIVFVMDNSTSTKNSGIDFSKNVQTLLDSIIESNPGVDLKIGVVKFRGYATDMLGTGLTKYDDSTSATINAAVANNTVPGSGSNGHSGLVMAEQLLSADSEVPNDHKYVVFLTDGKNYIWNNEKNEPVTIYQQWLKSATIQKGGKPYMNQYAGITQKENGAYPSIYNSVPQITDHQTLIFSEGLDIEKYDSAYYTNLFNSKHADLTGPTEYDFPAYYTKYYPADSYVGDVSVGDGTVTAHAIANTGSDVIPNMNGYKTYYEYVPQEGTFWKNVKYLQVNPYKVVYNEEDKQWYYDTKQVNEDFFLWHASALEKGPYVIGHYWKETIDAKYNTGSIVFYDGGSGTGSHITQSFDQWLVENSDYGAWISNAEQVEALFKGIDNSIRYMVAKGVVTDKITDDFILKNPDKVDGFRMTLGGEAVSAAFTDGKWNFGTANDDGVYPYVVEYDKDTKTITWTINVPIENLVPVKLSYDLILEDENSESKIYPTNKSAVLDFVTTDKETGTFTFEIPKVAYVRPIDISVKKLWDDFEDQDGKRPDKITVQLVGGKDTQEIELSAPNWENSFKGVPDSIASFDEKTGEPLGVTSIEYTVKEKPVDGYTSAPSGSVEKGFVITNTHEPELLFFIAKIWDDEQDADGIRPESVIVNLLANGEPIDEAELGDFNMWTASYTVPFYDADGEPIEYTVIEEPVEGYEKPVIVFDPDYSVYLVTNKHEVKEPPKTDDATNQWFWAGMMVSSMALIAVIFYLKRKQDEE